MRATITPAGILILGQETFRAALGRGGIRADKREGDGATPSGLLPLREVLYRPDRRNGIMSKSLVKPLAGSDGWCDDPGHPAYNRLVQLPNDASAEALWRDDAVYDIIGVLGWNDDPVQPGRGSAIFLHVAHHDYRPTAGCIALAPNDLLHVLAAGLIEILVTP
jgi:L,D-peptidoglycan transpeptidase YkuD (ErfK/YbiS/YcfS/YnhG family)